MNRPAMAREMLLAEAIGDLALVLDRLDRLLPAHERATEALVKAHTDLDARTDDFKRSIISFTDQAKAHTAKHIAHHVVEASRVAREAQTQAMADVAQSMFQAELSPVLRRLMTSVQPVVERLDRPWERWLTHAATASVSAVVSATLVIWLRSS